MKFIKKLVIALLVIIAFVLIAAVFLPSKKHIEDSITINAPAKDIYEQVVNLKNWQKWSPFAKGDSAMKNYYEGAPKGVGAIMRWESKKEGNGKMTIDEVQKYKSIKTTIEFEKQGTSHSAWLFEESKKSTRVTWSIDVEVLGYPVGRIMGLFMPNMIHKSFKEGLATLKKVSEEYSKMLMTFRTSDIKVKQVEKQYALIIKDSSTCDDVDLLFAKLYDQIGKYVGENKIDIVGAPFARYLSWNDKANKTVVEAGFFINKMVSGQNNISFIEFPGGKIVTAFHYGSYETVYKSHELIEKFLQKNKFVVKDIPREIYITDPEKEPDMRKWKTEIVYPVK